MSTILTLIASST